MVFISIVTGAYKPTYILGASQCTKIEWVNDGQFWLWFVVVGLPLHSLNRKPKKTKMQRGFLDLGFSVPWCHGLIPLPYRNSVFFGWPSQVQSMDFLSLLCDGFNPRKKNKKQHI